MNTPATLQDLLIELASRGLSVALSVESELSLEGPPHQATPSLRRAIRGLHDQLVAHLRGEQPEPDPTLPLRQWLWPTGHTYTETPADPYLFGRADRHPVGAFWVRAIGQSQWQRVPGRGSPECMPPQPPVAPQRQEDPPMPATRRCPFDGCRERIPEGRFACPAHWYKLTPAQKAEIWTCYDEWQAGKITGEQLRARQRAVLDQAQERSL